MSYEELRELDERISMVQRLSKEIISKQLQTRVHATSADSTEGKTTEICTVRQDGYENQDKIATLGCKHEHHEDCITQWLVQKNVFPICKRQALMMEESKGEEVNEYDYISELGERIGMVQRGVSKEIISRELKTRVHTTSANSMEKNTEICTICLDGYGNKDKIATLDCKHEYHEDCITQWLVRNNVCPICKRQGLTMEESKKEEEVYE
ncbi:hypothetical protein MKW98_029827 [Papaver atlanticum]|uniref:RING-type E3 ubiquitin transferase n=1 Tax=Papaver atlanticum TaxID=357466 RepID=A0AAD4TL79_9MAGN|nr:hypothetical protein MKW98_029827 [Papaver atlanticum]